MIVFVQTYDDGEGEETIFLSSSREGAERKACEHLLEGFEDEWDWDDEKDEAEEVLTAIEAGNYGRAIELYNEHKSGTYTASEEVVYDSVDIPLVEAVQASRKAFDEHHNKSNADAEAEES